MNWPQIPDEIIALLVTGGYGAFGSIVHYLYEIVRDDAKSFSMPMFIVNLIFGFFIGQVIGSFIPDNFAYRDGIILISGFLVYQILSLIELRGMYILKKKVFNDKDI